MRDALAAGVAQTGASVIVVDNGIDSGPVLAQERIAVHPGDDAHSLHERIKPVERRLLIDVVRRIATGDLELNTVSDPSSTDTEPPGASMAGPSIDPALYRHRDLVPVRRALVSVSDKTDLLPLAQALAEAGVEIVSTGGSAALLRDAGLTVTDVAEVTGFLSRSVVVSRRSTRAFTPDSSLTCASKTTSFSSVGSASSPSNSSSSTCYPFAETVASGAEGDAVVEQIDIGGPAMVRASAKNFANVAIVVSPTSYPAIIDSVRAGGTTLSQRRDLAARAFAHTCEYDRAVATWFVEESLAGDDLPRHLTIKAERLETLRYGENSHQRAAIYTRIGGHGIAQAEQLQGKEMSYNNYVDADAALRAAFDMVKPAVAIIKHANPCGIAVGAPQPSTRSPPRTCALTSAIRSRRSAA